MEEEESEGERPLGRDSARKARIEISAAQAEEKKADARLEAYLEKFTHKAAATSAYKTEVEAEIMMKDLSGMNPQQKEWYTRKQGQILRDMREVENSPAEVAPEATEATASPSAETPPAMVPRVEVSPPFDPLVDGFANKEAERAWIRRSRSPLFPEESTEFHDHTIGQGSGAYVDLQERDTESVGCDNERGQN